jgi:hypothetical protein
MLYNKVIKQKEYLNLLSKIRKAVLCKNDYIRLPELKQKKVFELLTILRHTYIKLEKIKMQRILPEYKDKKKYIKALKVEEKVLLTLNYIINIELTKQKPKVLKMLSDY